MASREVLALVPLEPDLEEAFAQVMAGDLAAFERFLIERDERLAQLLECEPAIRGAAIELIAKTWADLEANAVRMATAAAEARDSALAADESQGNADAAMMEALEHEHARITVEQDRDLDHLRRVIAVNRPSSEPLGAPFQHSLRRPPTQRRARSRERRVRVQSGSRGSPGRPSREGEEPPLVDACAEARRVEGAK